MSAAAPHAGARGSSTSATSTWRIGEMAFAELCRLDATSPAQRCEAVVADVEIDKMVLMVPGGVTSDLQAPQEWVSSLKDRDGNEISVAFMSVEPSRVRREPPARWRDDFVSFGKSSFSAKTICQLYWEINNAYAVRTTDEDSDAAPEPLVTDVPKREGARARASASGGRTTASASRSGALPHGVELEELLQMARGRIGDLFPANSEDEEGDDEDEDEEIPIIMTKRTVPAGRAGSASTTTPARQDGPLWACISTPVDNNELQSMVLLKIPERLENFDKKKKEKDNSDDDRVSGKAARAVRGMNKLRNNLRNHPEEIVKAYREQCILDLGAQDGRAWTYWDKNKRIPWRKLLDLKRVFFLVAGVARLLVEGEVGQGHAMAVQTLRVMEQVALNGGNWRAAWHLAGIQDPMGKRTFAGTEAETEAIAAYITEIESLEAKLRGRGGPAASSGGEEEGGSTDKDKKTWKKKKKKVEKKEE